MDRLKKTINYLVTTYLQKIPSAIMFRFGYATILPPRLIHLSANFPTMGGATRRLIISLGTGVEFQALHLSITHYIFARLINTTILI